LKKLDKVDKLVVQAWRVADALERIAGMRLKTPESRREEIETVERIDKGKGKEVMEEEYNNEQSKMDIEDEGDENNGIEEVEEAIGTPVSSV